MYLKDTVKPGIRQRFDEMRAMGIRTVMITGDNPLTAASIAEEAGVDDFLAQATPEDKMREIGKTGVDVISIGALTHSARAVDLSMEIRPVSEVRSSER